MILIIRKINHNSNNGTKFAESYLINKLSKNALENENAVATQKSDTPNSDTSHISDIFFARTKFHYLSTSWDGT